MGLNCLAPPVRHLQHEIAQILRRTGLKVHRRLDTTADPAVHPILEEQASEIITRHRMSTLFLILMLKGSINIACSAGINILLFGNSYPDKFPSSQQRETNPMIDVASYSDTTSTTVMRKHLADNHLATWVQGCDQLNISISSSGKMKKHIEDYRQQAKSQHSPESANGKPNQPQTEFSPEAFIDAIMEFIVGTDQVCFNCVQNVSLLTDFFSRSMLLKAQSCVAYF